MNKKVLMVIIAITVMLTVIINANLSLKSEVSSLTLLNVEALAFDESSDPCDGNPFYASNEALRQVRCLKYPLVFGYKMSCVTEDGRCCDPTTQTKCE